MAAAGQSLGGIQALQKEALLRMLSLSGDNQQQWSAGAQTWKILVYDRFCSEVVAPLLKIGSLRNHGVTLNTNLDNDRHPVPDLPAVYFVEPTAENIQKICSDLERSLYETCFINFASAVPRPLLEELAKGALAANAAHKVGGVFDRYVSFVSLSPALFSLNLTRAYEMLHSDKVADTLLESYVERIVDGLLSVLVTMRLLPIIRCPRDGPSTMVAQRLDARLRELLASGQAADLFSGSSGGSNASGGAGERPLFCIMDRDMDLVSMLGHAFTYQALAHDILHMKLNKLSVNVEGEGGKMDRRSYDLDDSDSFWSTHAGKLFPDVTDLVSEAFTEYDRKRREMSEEDSADGSAGGGLAPGLAAALNALPEMAERKRSIDMHTNIASCLKEIILERDVHEYCWLEDAFSSDSLGACVKEIEKRLTAEAKGTLLDKTRALMVLYLVKPQITSAQMDPLVEALGSSGADVSGLRFLQHLTSMRNMGMPAMPQPSGAAGVAGSMFGSLVDSAARAGAGLAKDGFKGLKDMVSSKKKLVICKIVEELMTQQQTETTETYLYLDPKAPAGSQPARVRSQFKRAVAFVVGGGNYVEFQSVQESAQKEGRQVIYGSTDLVNAEAFAEELCRLGASSSNLLSNLQ